MTNTQIRMSDEIRNALSCGDAIVGLESNVIAQGLPFPRNLELHNECDNIIRSHGAIPAMVFIDDGVICLGSSASVAQRLAGREKAQKVTTRDIGSCLASRSLGATSVSASIAICELAGIRIFATAGLGGVHRDYHDTMDMSGDLYEISRRKIAIVSAGVKKFLDVKKTVEVLETLNIPVLGYRTDQFPAFYCKDGGAPVPFSSDSWKTITQIVQTHLGLSIGGGALITVAPSDEIALDDALIEEAVSGALEEAKQREIVGKDITKHVMRAIDTRTNMQSRAANYSVMIEVVAHAADFAVQWSKNGRSHAEDDRKGAKNA